MDSMHDNHIDILKMDVEGEEYAFVQKHEDLKMISKRVGQILVEFHSIGRRHTFYTFLTQVIHPLERVGFYLNTIEPISYIGHAYEMTFVNINWDPVKKII